METGEKTIFSRLFIWENFRNILNGKEFLLVTSEKLKYQLNIKTFDVEIMKILILDIDRIFFDMQT